MTEMTSFTNMREYYVYIATKYSPAQRLRGLEPSSEGSGTAEAELSRSRGALAARGQHPHRDRIGGSSQSRRALASCGQFRGYKILYKV